MADMVTLTIDGREIEVPAGTRLFDACTIARDGEQLPHFCYHPDLPVAGVCRLCQVEIEGMPKLTIACNTFVREGMVVHTRNDRVRKAARQILELHLINHPVDCPICDQAGECGLQDQYMEYGLYETEVEKSDKVLKRKAEVIGPEVILDQERCVLCSRCVRFCEEVTGTGELGIYNRGDRAEIGVAEGARLDNPYSLNTVDICPVGALTSRDFRFRKRVWLLRGTSSICPGCSTGCNIRIDHEAGRVYRIKPRRNDEVNGPWMCDQGRFEYKRLHLDDRLEEPRIRRDGEFAPATWGEIAAALASVAPAGAGGLAVVSPRRSLEEIFLLRRLATLICGEGSTVSGPAESLRGDSDDILVSADKAPNRKSLQWLDMPELPAADLAERLRGSNGPVLVYGGDPIGDVPDLAAAVGDSPLIYLGSHDNATAKAAAVVIPLGEWAETSGIFVNRQGRLQVFRAAVARPGQAREDWRFLAETLAAYGDDAEMPGLPAVRRLVAASTPALAGMELNALPALGAIPPAVSAPAGGES